MQKVQKFPLARWHLVTCRCVSCYYVSSHLTWIFMRTNREAWPAVPTLPLPEHVLQHGILQPCISHPCRMTRGVVACYSDVISGTSRSTGSFGVSVPPLTAVSCRGETSRARRRKPEEASRQGAGQEMPAPSRHTEQRTGSPCPASTTRLVAHGRDEAGRPGKTGGHSGRSTDGRNMAEHRRRMPPEFIPARLNEQGAVPLAFSLTGEMPRGLNSVRRDDRRRHRHLSDGRALLLRKVPFLLIGHDSDNCLFSGELT